MLLLGSRTITIEGLTVFPDHADPDQFWYLPGPVQLARNREGRTAFTYIKYKPAAVAGGAKGGGFLMFAVNLRLDPDLERRILGKLRSVAPGRPRLAVVPFDEGTVQCVALNLQGAGGTAAQPAGPGSFNAVERILGASVPSLQGDNTAAFSLTLSQEGAIILEKAFEQGTEPVGVIYDLKFTGMRPALKVEITANLERVYNQFSGGLEAQVYFVRAGIDAAFEKLVQDGTIQIKVIDFTGEEDEKEKERWALDFFKENLLRQWFEPTLTPGQVAGGMVQPDSLDNVLRRGNELRPPATPAPPRPSSEPTPAATPRRSPPSPTAGTGQGEDKTAGHNVQPGQPAQGASPTENSGFPAASEAVPPAAAVGAHVPPARAANLPASMSSSPNAAGSPALVSFRLRFVRQEERKTVKLVYDRSEATQRTHAPQGFFGLLVADLAKENHFVEVDLDDPFFRVFSVNVEAPIDFQRLGLTSAQIALDYGDASDPATLKHGDFVFDAQNHEPHRLEVFMNKHLDTTYRYAVQYHFDPLSGWDGSTFSYELPARVTEDRTLLLNPFEHLGFLEVQVVPMRIDWAVVDSIDVHLQHRSANGVTLDKTLTLTQASQPQTWKLRVEAPGARDYTYHCVHHLKDGSTRQSEPLTSRASLLPVDDPFPDALEIEFIPLLDSSKTKMVFVDVEYDDEPNQYHREERLRIMGNDLDAVRLGIAQMNPDLKTFRYRLTVVGANNAIRRDPFVETTETLIAVAD